MIRRNSRGQTIRVFSYSSPMRAHGGDAHVHTDDTIARLNSIPTRATPCNALGVLVRKARR